MLLVYALLEEHPATAICEQFICGRIGWFTTALNLLEVKAILTKVYGIEPNLVSEKLAQIAAGPIVIAGLEPATVLAAMNLADRWEVDLTDAVLLHVAQEYKAKGVATDDTKLAEACHRVGIVPENPIQAEMRKQIAQWEINRLPMKGLPRILHRIYRWLNEKDASFADSFWNNTGHGSHLP